MSEYGKKNVIEVNEKDRLAGPGMQEQKTDPDTFTDDFGKSGYISDPSLHNGPGAK